MLKTALNALTMLYSRQATLKRLGASELSTFSPCRITPSNYFRALRGPEYTTIKGAEFIIPVDSMLGQYSQKLSFSAIPDEGTFRIEFGGEETTDLNFDVTAVEIQTALRLLTGLANVLVTGSFNTGFTIIFVGFDTFPALGVLSDSSLKESDENVTASWIQTNTAWNEPIRKGDRIIDGSKNWAIDEIIPMHDLGAIVMAYRVRCD